MARPRTDLIMLNKTSQVPDLKKDQSEPWKLFSPSSRELHQSLLGALLQMLLQCQPCMQCTYISLACNVPVASTHESGSTPPAPSTLPLLTHGL